MLERLLTLMIGAGLTVFQTTAQAQHKEIHTPKVVVHHQDPQGAPNALQTLTNATRLDGAYTGLANRPGPNYLAYHELKPQVKDLYPQLIQRFPDATPVGQLYLASLIQDIEPVKGTQLLKDLASSDIKIMQISGCIVSPTTVGAIAAKLIDSEANAPF